MFQVSRRFQNEDKEDVEIEIAVGDEGVIVTKGTHDSTEVMMLSHEEALVVLMLFLDSSGVIMSKKAGM